MTKYSCIPCSGLDLSACGQHLFLGASIESFNVSVGWNNSTSVLRTSLKEDPCVAEKICYNSCLTPKTITAADPGFIGHSRYQRANGTQYSANVKESPSDTLIRSGVDLVGAPVFFRACDFEWCGIVQSFSHTRSPGGGNTYNVEVVDPRIILDKVSLIIGEYGGYVNQTTGGCYPANLINVYGYLEQFGLPCLPYVQCWTGGCDAGTYAVAGTCTTIDGTVFGSPNGGFAGSGWNEEGMTITAILAGLNILVNSIPINSWLLPFSPYGRVCYCSQDISAVDPSGCGIMQPESSADPCYDGKHFYLMDLTELGNFVPANYRIQGPVITVSDLINQLSSVFGFDYYVDLVPVIPGIADTSCIDKIIKLRCVSRNVTPALGVIADFIEDNSDCVVEYTTGLELRSENGGKFLIGGFKQHVYQAFQNTNPDGSFWVSNDGDTMVCHNSDTGLLDLITYTPRATNSGDILDPIQPYKFTYSSTPFGQPTEEEVIDNANTITIDGYPNVNGATLCSELDDMIIPFFGISDSHNYIIPCKDGDGNWFFDAPSWELQSQLSILNTPGATIRISENEMRAALEGFDDWQEFIQSFNTETSQMLPLRNGSLKSLVGNAFKALADPDNSPPALSRDVQNPHITKFISNTNSQGQRTIRDIQSIFDWVSNYAKEFYGKKFAVRIPFSCCSLDLDTLRIRISDFPNNDGGWTEQPCVLGLPNNPLGLGNFEFLNFFRTDDGRVKPFVRYDKGVLKDVAGLGKDDYFYFYNIPASSLSQFDSGAGPPFGSPGTSSGYIDTLNNKVYVYDHGNAAWLDITSACVFSDSGSPPSTGIPEECLGLYVNIDTCQVYVSTDTTPSLLSNSGWTVDGGDWAEIDVYLYLRAEIQDEFVFYDKSTCSCPRVVVEVPQAVSLREQVVSTRLGLDKAIIALSEAAGASGTLTADEKVETLTHGIGGTTAWVSMHDRACIPDAVAFPVRSTVITYGPWTDPASNCGSMEAVQDPEYVPWNFGSYASMNLAASGLVVAARSDLKVGELGQICVPGLPTIPLGAELGAVGGGFYGGGHLLENRTISQDAGTDPFGSGTNVGYYQLAPWTGLYGPNITNINVSIQGGVPRTCYSMRTFSPPRREGVARWLIDQMQKTRAKVELQVKYIRSVIENVKRQRLARSLAARDEDKRRAMHGTIVRESHPAEILAGQIKKNDVTSRTNIVNANVSQTSEEMQTEFNTKAFMSMDGIFRPVSLDGNGGLPRLVVPTGASGLEDEINSTAIKQDDLNFLTNPADGTGGAITKRNWVAQKRSDTPEIGHDIDIVGRDGNLAGTPSTGMIMPTGPSGIRDYRDDYRFISLRGPLMLTSWGYDCDDYPVPNKNDSEGAIVSGMYKTSDASGGLSAKFLDGHLQKPHTWPTAPIDLRLNKERGVWEAWACNGGGGNSNWGTLEGCSAGDPVVPGEECIEASCVRVMLGTHPSGGLRLNRVDSISDPTYDASGMLISSGGEMITELLLGTAGSHDTVQLVSNIYCTDCELRLETKLIHVRCGLVVYIEDGPDLPTNCSLPLNECPSDCTPCPDSYLVSIPDDNFDCGILSCVNGHEFLVSKLGEEINISGQVPLSSRDDCVWLEIPIFDNEGWNMTNLKGVPECCDQVLIASELSNIDPATSPYNDPCRCVCDDPVGIFTPTDVSCNGINVSGQAVVATCWACHPSLGDATNPLNNFFCLEDCPYNICLDQITFSLACEDGIWELSFGVGTAGLCGQVGFMFTAYKPVPYFNPLCAGSTCPPSGIWEGVWSISNSCPDGDDWVTDVNCEPDVFVGEITLFNNDDTKA